MNKSQWLYLISIIIAVTVAVIESAYGQKNLAPSTEDAWLINGSAIKRIDYLTAVTMMEEEKQQTMKPVDYQLIVDRLTEEELLFQYGLEQGAIYHPEISQVIVSNILETIVVQHSSEQYNDEKLYAIYQEKIIAHYGIDNVPTDMQFAQVKTTLSAALREVERNKAVQKYINWLRKRSDISSSEINEERL